MSLLGELSGFLLSRDLLRSFLEYRKLSDLVESCKEFLRRIARYLI